jgi:hypothetical protein
MFGALYSSFRKFWFVWVRSSFITYWVPFRITGLDDHDKDENIEESIKTVHKFLTKTIKMEIKEQISAVRV